MMSQAQEAYIKIMELTDKNTLEEWIEIFEEAAWIFGHNSNEMYKFYKEKLNSEEIPMTYKLPLLCEIYVNYGVDKTFSSIIKKIIKAEPIADKEKRIKTYTDIFQNKLNENNYIEIYRGVYSGMFGEESRGNSVDISKAVSFTFDYDIALKFARRWFPVEAKIIKVKIPVDKVVLYTDARKESEIIIIPLGKSGIKKFEITEEVIDKSRYPKY